MNTNQKYPYLSRPVTIAGKRFRNRILTSPVSQPFYSENGKLSLRAYYHLMEQAEGGFSQITIGEQPVDPALRFGKGFSIFEEDMDPNAAKSLADLTNDIHCKGALVSMEIGHYGADVHVPDGISVHTCGPVGYVRDDGTVVDALDEDGMDILCGLYARAAMRLKLLGFDGCVVHAAHGALLAQFLSARTNMRKDEYGGTIANRAKFPVRVLESIRKSVGKDFLIELRISGSEFIDGGIDVDDNMAFAAMLEGKVDLLHISAGMYSRPELFIRTHPTVFLPEACNAEIAAAIKSATNIPIILVGAISDPDTAERLLENEVADFIALGRQAIADPFYARKVLAGKKKEISPCIRCFKCMDISPQSGMTLHCSVNPRAGKAAVERRKYPKADASHKIAVIGGGVAGMTAALTASRCGHEVILFEKSSALGGVLNAAKNDRYKREICRLLDNLEWQINKSAIDVRLNTTATPEMVANEKPDAILAAIGAFDAYPSFPVNDCENFMSAEEAYKHPDRVGNKVVIIGGGLTGCESAIHWVDRNNCRVTLISRSEELARDGEFPHRIGLLQKLNETVSVYKGVTCVAVDRKSVICVNRDGIRTVLNADTVIYATGRMARSEEAERFCGIAAEFDIIGDARKAGRIMEAISSGYYAARVIGREE